MSLSEIDTLRRLRRHRADRAERALGEAKRAQARLQAQVENARAAVAQARVDQARETAELASRHQGQVLSLQAIRNWRSQESELSADTARHEEHLSGLRDQHASHVPVLEEAQKQVSRCLRDVEKLRELAALISEESS